MSKESRENQLTELTILNNLFNQFLTESTYNVLIGSLIGLSCGAVLRRPKIGFCMGIGFPFGLTMSKYNSLFQQVKITKQPPSVTPYYTTEYFMEKLSAVHNRLWTRFSSFKKT